MSGAATSTTTTRLMSGGDGITRPSPRPGIEHFLIHHMAALKTRATITTSTGGTSASLAILRSPPQPDRHNVKSRATTRGRLGNIHVRHREFDWSTPPTRSARRHAGTAAASSSRTGCNSNRACAHSARRRPRARRHAGSPPSIDRHPFIVAGGERPARKRGAAGRNLVATAAVARRTASFWCGRGEDRKCGGPSQCVQLRIFPTAEHVSIRDECLPRIEEPLFCRRRTTTTGCGRGVARLTLGRGASRSFPQASRRRRRSTARVEYAYPG